MEKFWSWMREKHNAWYLMLSDILFPDKPTEPRLLIGFIMEFMDEYDEEFWTVRLQPSGIPPFTVLNKIQERYDWLVSKISSIGGGK